MSTAHVRALLDHIDAELPRDSWPHWTEGWPQEIEAGLLDAAFTARATYGTPTSGVRAVITRWRDHRTVPLDDLTALAAHADDPEGLLEILGNRQRVSGNYTTKAEAVATAARALTELGCITSADLRDDDAQRNALVGVPGFGIATWECFAMQLGIHTPESRELLCDFVNEALELESPASATQAEDLVAAAAARLEITSAAFAHAVWRYQRAQRRVAGAR
ncbi:MULTISPECIES: hypothetical protein [unclassified Rhodococcus (in: high G+C Gram-positive bacteria)]|uniref:hypothetical protein n=1 Tax=unclassified Rhodococcus (in: high G+C Gram-positive bacteria) TaxID=192944 RepID=UPI001639A2D1|nr:MULTISPECIES: hypothetical protein [unclassified Rhodococcus (in: high G+C Gram-positive bacteria)]MBC2638866.1 hypothetical protein [Rhodococcus sp. 3A]MBC2896393.1 hypothetical protein [Rhodococcus sp. 4CII]